MYSLLTLLVFGILTTVFGATITITPNDPFTTIESARTGDSVYIAPGIYNYRVFLSQSGTADSPIRIAALDPNNPPVWDYAGLNVTTAQGSYNAADADRGCWQIFGASYVYIFDVVIMNCQLSIRTSGLRYYGSTSAVKLYHMKFLGNYRGITGGSENSELTAEYLEVGGSSSENLSIYDGNFTLRYSYVHDSQGNMLKLASDYALIEYNWFSRTNTFFLQVLTSGFLPIAPEITVIFRGNVVVHNDSTNSQFINIINQAPDVSANFRSVFISNTFVIFSSAAIDGFLHLSNSVGTYMSVYLYNNIFYGVKIPVYADYSNYTLVGSGNWMSAICTSAQNVGTIGTGIPFRDINGFDFSLISKSLTGTADRNDSMLIEYGIPQAEYYKNENVTSQFRVRTTAFDIGAFETTTVGTGTGIFSGIMCGPVPCTVSTDPNSQIVLTNTTVTLDIPIVIVNPIKIDQASIFVNAKIESLTNISVQSSALIFTESENGKFPMLVAPCVNLVNSNVTFILNRTNSGNFVSTIFNSNGCSSADGISFKVQTTPLCDATQQNWNGTTFFTFLSCSDTKNYSEAKTAMIIAVVAAVVLAVLAAVLGVYLRKKFLERELENVTRP